MTNYTRSSWQSFFPFLSWHELKVFRVIRTDFIAGLTVALILIPQSMAYAQLAGLNPIYGLYASFIPVAVASLWGSSSQLATGPVAIVSLLTFTAVTALTSDPSEFIFFAVILAFLVGLFQFLLGVFRLGILVDFLSHPVVIGFTNAAAIIIGTSQLYKLLGVMKPDSQLPYYQQLADVLSDIPLTHMPSLLMGAAALVIIFGLKKISTKMPPFLVALVVTTLISWAIGFESKLGGSVVGVIPQGLPPFSLPSLDTQAVTQLVPVAIIISLIGFMEAISVAKAVAAKTKQKIDANQELIGQGLSNIAASFFQGYPVSGSFSRTAVNTALGAITGFSSVVTAVVLGLTLLFLTPLLYHLPQATLAAVVMSAVAGLVRFKAIKYAWRVQKHDGFIAVVVFVVTFFTAPHLEQGIILGVVLTLFLYIWRGMRPVVIVETKDKGGNFISAVSSQNKTCASISILRFDGSLIFANTGYFETKVLEQLSEKPELQYIIIDAVSINEIDATGEEMLHELSRRLVDNNIELLFVRVHSSIMHVFKNTGYASAEWIDHFFTHRKDALEYIWSKLPGGCACDDECPLKTGPIFEDPVSMYTVK
jgi:SulP family sulfate permease